MNLTPTPNQKHDPRRPASLERGAFRPIVTTRGARDAVDALATRTIIRADEWRRCGRKSVWSWPPDAEAKSCGDEPRDDGGNQARSPGRARHKRVPWKGTVLERVQVPSGKGRSGR